MAKKESTKAAATPLATLLGSLPCPEGLLCVKSGDATHIATATAMWVSYDPVTLDD